MTRTGDKRAAMASWLTVIRIIMDELNAYAGAKVEEMKSDPSTITDVSARSFEKAFLNCVIAE